MVKIIYVHNSFSFNIKMSFVMNKLYKCILHNKRIIRYNNVLCNTLRDSVVGSGVI